MVDINSNGISVGKSTKITTINSAYAPTNVMILPVYNGNDSYKLSLWDSGDLMCTTSLSSTSSISIKNKFIYFKK